MKQTSTRNSSVSRCETAASSTRKILMNTSALTGIRLWEKCLTEMTPDQVIQTILDSGLRGRGGGGFPTGLKWAFAAANEADQKYVCCNADEGDPGAFMDRSVLEGDPACPYRSNGDRRLCDRRYLRVTFMSVRSILSLSNVCRSRSIRRVNTACWAKISLIPALILILELRLGAGAFVCGEETALMTSIEGHRGEPRPRPPFPAVKGLFGKPTVLNNVETYANIPQIILNGAEWFASMGTEKSKGTKVFALGGKITQHRTGGSSDGHHPARDC